MNLYLPPNLAARLKTLAQQDNRSVSQYLRLLVERALAQPINESQCN